MTLLDFTPWWWTRKEDQKEGSAPLKASTFGGAEQKGNFFWWLLSQLCSPKDREIFQPEKWWKPHQRQPWHGMAQHDFCLMCWGLTSLCISKGKLDKKIALTEIQGWHFYQHHHPRRWKLPLHAVLPQIFAYMSNSMLVQKGNFKVQCILHETSELHDSQR